MLTKMYIEALLVDEELADQVWDLWYVGLISDDLAAWRGRGSVYSILHVSSPKIDLTTHDLDPHGIRFRCKRGF